MTICDISDAISTLGQFMANVLLILWLILFVLLARKARRPWAWCLVLGQVLFIAQPLVGPLWRRFVATDTTPVESLVAWASGLFIAGCILELSGLIGALHALRRWKTQDVTGSEDAEQHGGGYCR